MSLKTFEEFIQKLQQPPIWLSKNIRKFKIIAVCQPICSKNKFVIMTQEQIFNYSQKYFTVYVLSDNFTKTIDKSYTTEKQAHKKFSDIIQAIGTEHYNPL